MAHSLSAAKRIRQNAKRRLHNRSNRSRLRTRIAKIRRALAANDVEQARTLFPETASLIDRMVKKGVIHDNVASRYKSRLARKLSQTPN